MESVAIGLKVDGTTALGLSRYHFRCLGLLVFALIKMVPVNETKPNMSDNGEKLELQSVPVVDVTKDNFLIFEPTIRLGIQNCDFIAIDCELSGLGDRKKLNA